jgi:hypothetical protein
MLDKTFDPQKIIDREFEQELFEELLQLKDPARILAIRDAGGMGKSQLLQKFQYRCRTAERPRIPVCLVDLGQLPDQSPLSLVLQLHRELAAFLTFPSFTPLDTARRAYDFTTIRGSVNLQEANLSGARVTAGGVVNQFDHAGSVTVQGGSAIFTPEQQEMAQARCVQAFLADLTQHCQQQTVVLLLDGYEHCADTLQRWLVDHLLEPYCFDLSKRPPRLLLVLAGRQITVFQQHWSAADCERLVKSVHALGKWTAAHVKECLRVHGFRYNRRQLRLFCNMIEEGFTPYYVVNAMETLFSGRNR